MYPCGWQEIRRELGIETIEEQKVQLSKVMHPVKYLQWHDLQADFYSFNVIISLQVNKTCEKCGNGEATFYTRQVLLDFMLKICQFYLKLNEYFKHMQLNLYNFR